MSETLAKAAKALAERLGDGFDGSAKFVLTGEGAIVVDGGGVRVEDGEADVTLSADPETFEAILTGELNATAAYMSGRLTIEGDMGQAMRLGAALA